MPTFQLETPEGAKYNIESDLIENARRAFDHAFAANPPPPGVIIHDVNRSYVTGGAGAPSVDTRGMAAGVGMGAVAGQPGLPSREEAAAALALRRDQPLLPSGAGVAPFLQGATASFGDEALSLGAGLGSAVRGGSFGGAYNLAQEAQRQELAQQRTEHPVLSPVLQAGGALTSIPLLAAAGAPAALTGGTSLGARILGSGLLGAGYGGIEGFGAGSGATDRFQQAGLGAATGAAIGAAIPPASELLGSGFRSVLDRSSVNRNLRQMGVDRPAGDAVMRMLGADDAFTGVGRQNILAAGPQGMLADAGPGTQGLLDVAIQRGGGGSRIAREAVEARGTEANRTLTDALDAALGQPRGLQTMQTEIRQAGQPARHAAYETAYSTPIDYSAPEARTLESLLGRLRGEGGSPDAVIAEANRLMRIRGEPPSAQVRATIAKDGSVTFDRLPDVRQIDYITRGLRAVAQKEETAGIMGGTSDIGGAYRDLAGDVRRTTRGLVPEYGTALDTAADDIGRIEATKLGNDILSPSMTRDEAAHALRRHNTSAAEMDAVRAGVRQRIDDQMANVRRIATDPNLDAREAAQGLKDLSSRAAGDKLDLILDPIQRQQLTNQIEEATRAIQLRANMTANSKTFARTAIDQATQRLLEYGPVGAAARGQPLNMLQRATQRLSGYTPEYDLGRQDVINRQIAELLTNARGPAAQQQLGLLEQAYQAAPQNAATAQQGGGLFGLLGGIPGYEAVREYLRGR